MSAEKAWIPTPLHFIPYIDKIVHVKHAKMIGEKSTGISTWENHSLMITLSLQVMATKTATFITNLDNYLLCVYVYVWGELYGSEWIVFFFCSFQ